MSLVKLFYRRDSLKFKILSIKDALEREIKPLCKEKFRVEWYGAYDIDPKHLAFWICVQSDVMKDAILSNADLMHRLRSLLEIHQYPAEARPNVHIGIESQETVDRESNGDWHVHFK